MGRVTPITRNVVKRTSRNPELKWEDVDSETIERFAYVPEYKDLLVRFRSGGDYRYRNVEPPLVARLRRPHPWHEIGPELRDSLKYPVERLATIRTRPLKGRTKRKKA